MKEVYYLALLLLGLLSCSEPNQQQQAYILNVFSGTVERIDNFESQFVAPRNVDIWLPDGYSADQQYAVLYMHDGQMLYDSTRSWNKQEWGVDETMSTLLEADQIPKTIVVGIWNTEFRHSEYFPQKPFEALSQTVRDSLMAGQRQAQALFKKKVCSDDYLKFIVQELKPFIDARYSTLSDTKNTYIAGSSMGGLISMYALCEFPDVFSGAACLSTHWPGIFDTLNNPIPEQFANYLERQLPETGGHKIYFDYGTETLDALYEPYQVLVDSVLLRRGYDMSNWKTLKFEGANHSEIAWSKRLHIPISFLLAENQ